MCRGERKLSEEQKRLIKEKTAAGAREGLVGRKHDNAQKELEKAAESIAETRQFDTMVEKATLVGRREAEKGVSGTTLTGKLASWMYNAIKKMLPNVLKGVGRSIAAAILYAACLAAALMVVVKLGLLTFNIALIVLAIEGTWQVIKSVTRFSWNAFLESLEKAEFWAGIMGIGCGITVACPIVGIPVIVGGGIGTAVTAVAAALK